MVLAILVALGQGAGVARAEAPASKREVVAALLERSGTNDVIRNFLAGVRTEMQRRAAEIAGDEAAFVEHTFEAAFDEAAMREQLTAHLLAHYDDAAAREALAWFESELGEKVRGEEELAQSAEAETAMREYIAALEQAPPSQDRMALAAELEGARQSASLNHILLFEFMRGLTLVTTAATEAFDTMPSEAEIDASWRAQLDPLATTLTEQMVVFFGFMGRNLTLDENRAYLAHLRSDAGQWFYRESSQGLARAIGRAGRAFGYHVAVRLHEVRAQAELAGGEAIEEARAKLMAEARTWATGRDADACIDAIAERRRACEDARCIALLPAFASTCFDIAKDGAASCAGIPDPTETAATIFWRADACAARETSDTACHVAFSAKQRHCAGS